MQVLDGKNHAGGRYERFIRDMILDLLNGEQTRWGLLNWPPIPNLNLPSASQREAADSAFITRLRAFVDGFIQTGFDSSGIETPSSRRVRASVDEAPIMTVSADEAPVVIFDEIYESWRRNQPRPLLNGDGTLAVGVGQPRWENQAPELYARDMATYYFQRASRIAFLELHRQVHKSNLQSILPSQTPKEDGNQARYLLRQLQTYRRSGEDSFKPRTSKARDASGCGASLAGVGRPQESDRSCSLGCE